MSEWRAATLGELFEPDNSRLGSHDAEPTVFSLSKYDGFVRADEYFGKRIASAKLDAYKVVPDGGWAFSTIHIDEGSIARNALGETGVISPMYTTMKWKSEDDLPEFADLLVRLPRMLEEYKSRAQGSINRRRSLPFKTFAAIEVALPSLPEQQRIVDLMSAVDRHIETLHAEVEAARQVLKEVLATTFSTLVGDETPITGLCTNVVGGIWGSPEGESEVDVLALGPRIYTPGTPDFVTDESPLRSFTRKQVDSRLIREHDIILERSGGSPEQPVGRVAIAGAGLAPCVPTDFQRLLRPDPSKVLPRYLFWRLRHDWNSGVTRNYSRRTTGITNLSVKDYLARRIVVPSDADQQAAVQTVESAQAMLAALQHELAAIRSLRSTVLTALLSQEIAIPQSYDTLMGVES